MNITQTKPLRNFGIDVTQMSMQPILDELGIDKSVKEMSQAEKEILRYIATLRQAKFAMGDLANTIESPSNQLKIFRQQLIETKIAISSLFMGIWSNILPYANAILMVIKEISKAIASMLGIRLKDYNTGIASSSGAYDDMSDSIDGATESAKELKKQTLGFDELHEVDNSKNGGINSNVTGGIDQKLLDSITGYENGMENVRMKATEIRDKIMDWLGFTKLTNETTGEVSFKLKDGYTNLKGIIGVFTTMGTVFGISKIVKFGKSIFDVTKKTKLFTSIFSLSSKPLLGIIGIIGSLIGIFIHAYNTSDVFREKVDEMVKNVSQLFGELYESVSNVTKKIWEFIEPSWNIIKDTVIFAVKTIYDTIVGVFSNIVDIISGTCKIIDAIFKGDLKGAFDAGKEMVTNLWDNWKEYFGKIGENFYKWKDSIIENTIKLKDKMIEKLTGILDWIKELPNKFFYYAGLAVGTLWKVITETDWIELGKKVANGIINGIKNISTSLSNFGNNLFNKLWESISNINWKEIGQQVLNGIKNGLMNIGETLKGWGTSFVKGLKDALGIHSPSQLVIDAKIGKFTTDGILVGMEKEIPRLQKTAYEMVNEMQKVFANGNYDVPLNYNIPTNASPSSDMSVLNNIVISGIEQIMSKYSNSQQQVDVTFHANNSVVIDEINQKTKQTGVFPLNIPTY